MILNPNQNHRWRKAKSRFIALLCILFSIIVVSPLAIVFIYLIIKGFSSLNWDFFTQVPVPIGEPGGGMANAIVGTGELLLLSGAIGIPIGVLGGIYLSEFGKDRVNSYLRFSADVLNGVPSIVWGIVAYTIVVATHFKWQIGSFVILNKTPGFSLLAGGIALGLMMIPMVIRTTEEVLQIVPGGYREAALALGIARWKTTLLIVTRTAMKGIVTGVLLALARVSGETAPLLFTAFGNLHWSHSVFQPVAALPLQIFAYATSAYQERNQQAWAGALTLLVLIFIVNFVVRFILRDKKIVSTH